MRLISVLTATATATATAFAACVWAPVASANDKSVYGAWVSRDADFAKLGRQYRKDAKLWVHSGHKRQGPVLGVLAKSQKLCAAVNRAIAGESPSSANGKRGKVAAVASDNYLARYFGALAKSIRARTAGHVQKSRSYSSQANGLLSRSAKAEKRARKAFRAAGVQIKP